MTEERSAYVRRDNAADGSPRNGPERRPRRPDSSNNRFPTPLSRLSLLFAVAGLALSLIVAGVVYVQSSRTSEASSQADAHVLADALAQRARIVQAYLRAVAARIRGRDELAASDFDSFVSFLGPEPALQMVLWAPRVPLEQRQRFESETGLRIREPDNGDLVPAGPRDVYFPVRFAAGARAEARDLGLDLGATLTGIEAIDDAARSRETITTRPTSLESGEPGFQMSEAVTLAGGDELAGVVVGSIRLDLLVAAAAPAALVLRDVAIEDITAGAGDPVSVHAQGETYDARDWPYKDIVVGGRTWRVHLERGESRAPENALIVFLIGMTITGLSVVLADRAQQRLVAQDLRREVTRQTAAFQRSSAEFRALFEEGGTGKCELVPETRHFRRVNMRLSDMLGYSREELVRLSLADVMDDDEQAEPDAAYRSLLDDESDAYLAERRFRRKDGSGFWGEISATVLRDEAGRPVWTVAVIQDITQRKQAEETRQLLVRELAHRVKNTMQVARSLADQTGRYATDLGSFLALYQGRLRALAMAHDQLFETDWAGARLADIVEGTLTAFETDPGRISVDLPDVFLSSSESQTLALILNELATNAAKHGALSSGPGRVAISGEVLDASGEPGEPREWLAFEWRESGGRSVPPPERSGFGLTFLTRAVQHQHGGSTGFEWLDDGVRYTLRLPLHGADPAHRPKEADVQV